MLCFSKRGAAPQRRDLSLLLCVCSATRNEQSHGQGNHHWEGKVHIQVQHQMLMLNTVEMLQLVWGYYSLLCTQRCTLLLYTRCMCLL